MKNKKSGIYCIENLKNGKKYIGQSIDLEKRKHEHFSLLKGNNHSNTHLQNSYNKYGEENFKFRVLLYCEPFELTKYEQFFVDYYTPELLYNVRLECVNSNQGITFSKETRKKMSEAWSGKNNLNYGKHLSKETRKKLSEANSGKNHPMYGKHHSEETKEKISNALSGENSPMYGKHLSKETRKKLSEAHKKENLSEETKRKMSEAKYGKHLSKKTKEKMSEAKRGENNSNSKLTESQVFEILDLYYNKNKTQTDIAKKFLVNNVAIFSIVREKTWKSCYKKFMENNKEKYGNKS